MALVFDMDGLMFNTEELYEFVADEILRRRGKQCSGELIDAMMGRQPPVAIQIMIDWCQLDDTVQEIAAETEAIFAEILESRLATMPGLLELLDAAEATGIPKAVATSSGRRFVESVLARLLDSELRRAMTVPTLEEGETRTPLDELGAEVISIVEPMEEMENQDGRLLQQMFRIEVVATWWEDNEEQEISAETWRYGRLYQP